ncbi:hypothetical protein F7R12_03675 [Pseudomonas tolaasii]|nr:hypothetical protein B5P22_05785 [Pseudomonas tolaasii]KAB0478362.1 hypothetical protein F7R12_03675 [Pseudomonas tolaasii]
MTSGLRGCGERACPNASQLRANAVPVARELAPAGLRSSPRLFKQRAGAASRPSGSKLPRHRKPGHHKSRSIYRPADTKSQPKKSPLGRRA